MPDYTNLKKTLGEMLEKKKQDKANEETQRQAKNDGDRNKILENISGDLKTSLEPVLADLAKNSKLSTDDIRQALSEAIQINMPEVKMPEFNIPAPVVNVPAPIVNVPRQEAPKITVQPTPVTFPSEMSLKAGSRPFPVIMMDQAGKPMQFGQSGGATGGKSDFFTILGIQNTILAVNSDPAGVAYSSANPFPVTITSGASATSASAIIDSSGVQYSGSNPFPVTISSGSGATTASNIVDSSGVAYSGSNPVPVTFSAASSQNVNVFDAQQSIVTSHQDSSGDFRGLDTTVLRTINTVSNYNSTTTTLAGNATFTGLAEDVKDYSTIQLSIIADQASATDGLSLQQSSDGSNWDITDVYTIPISTGKTFSVQVAARYYRVVYTNGATIQGAFRIQSVLHQTAPKPSSQRPMDGLSNENDFEQVSAYLGALNASGTWDRIHTGGFDSLGALRTSQATDSVSSVVINSGTLTAVTTVTSITNTVAAALVDSSGVQYSGSNPLIVDANDALGQGDSTSAIRIIQAGDSVTSVIVNSGTITTVTAVTSVTNSIAAAIIDSGGVQYSTSNPLPVSIASSITQNVTLAGVTDSTIVYQARTTLPTAVADGADVRPKADKLGRGLTRLTARELLVTAYATLSTGTETTLATATAGGYLDLIQIIAANTSTAAQQIDLRAVSAGNIVLSLFIPANATAGAVLSSPWPQDATGNAWTVDGPDNTNSSILVSALFSKES